MILSLFRRRVMKVALLALLIAGPAYAAVNFLPGFVWQAATPVSPPASYFFPVTISPALYGDTILGIETGRDDRSPFAAIVVMFNNVPYPTIPQTPPPPPNPIINAITPYVPNLPNYPTTPPYNPNPPPAPPGFVARFTYRPIDDPANPGWGPLPGGANQLDNAVQTCAAVAAELTAFRTAAQGPTGAAFIPAPPMSPVQLYLETDASGGVSQLEFYKYQIIR